VSSKVAKAYKGAKTLIIPCCDAVPLLALSTFGDVTWIVMILFMLRHPRWPKHIGAKTSNIPCCDAVPLLALATFGDATKIVIILFMLHHSRWPRHIGGKNIQPPMLRCCTPSWLGHIQWHDTSSNLPYSCCVIQGGQGIKRAKTSNIPCCDAVPLLALATFGDATQIVMILFMLHHPRWPRHIGRQNRGVEL